MKSLPTTVSPVALAWTPVPLGPSMARIIFWSNSASRHGVFPLADQSQRHLLRPRPVMSLAAISARMRVPLTVHTAAALAIGPAPDRWSAVTILDLMSCDDTARQMLFAGSLVARIPLETLHRNAILVGARILRVAAGAPQQEAFDSIAAQVDPTDLPRLRAAIQTHLSASSPAIR